MIPSRTLGVAAALVSAAALGSPMEARAPQEAVALPVVAAAPAARPLEAVVADAVAKGVAYLRSVQEEDGSFGAPRNVMFNESFATFHTYEAWTYATTGLGAMALAECGATAADEVALDKAVDALLKRPLPKRVSEWDTDNVWAYVYGVQAFARLLPRERFAKDPRRAAMVARANELIAALERWQTPFGGWAYYDTDATTIPPVWSTSFTTAAAVIGLLDAEKAGLTVNARMLNKALACVQHARLPDGAYTYNVDAITSPAGLEFINQVKGSLGRIQVGNVALMRGGLLDGKAVKGGLEQFFEHHRFLAVARKKPIPHESWYAVAAYFFLFGHYYASEAIDLLPTDQRAPFAKQLQQKLLEIQEDDGAFWDFHISEYTRAYGTAFAIMALQRTLRATAEAKPTASGH